MHKHWIYLDSRMRNNATKKKKSWLRCWDYPVSTWRIWAQSLLYACIPWARDWNEGVYFRMVWCRDGKQCVYGETLQNELVQVLMLLLQALWVPPRICPLGLKDTVSWELFTASGSPTLSALSTVMTPEPWEEGVQYRGPISGRGPQSLLFFANSC